MSLKNLDSYQSPNFEPFLFIDINYICQKFTVWYFLLSKTKIGSKFKLNKLRVILETKTIYGEYIPKNQPPPRTEKIFDALSKKLKNFDTFYPKIHKFIPDIGQGFSKRKRGIIFHQNIHPCNFSNFSIQNKSYVYIRVKVCNSVEEWIGWKTVNSLRNNLKNK